jgi:hypothetical protein
MASKVDIGKPSQFEIKAKMVESVNKGLTSVINPLKINLRVSIFLILFLVCSNRGPSPTKITCILSIFLQVFIHFIVNFDLKYEKRILVPDRF